MQRFGHGPESHSPTNHTIHPYRGSFADSEWLFEMTQSLGDRWLLEREQFLRRSAPKQGSEKLTDARFARRVLGMTSFDSPVSY
jgi:hypothetical protein